LVTLDPNVIRIEEVSMLKVGAKAPLFTLADKEGIKIALKDVSSPFSVVYFYPKDDTPGCTLEAIEFTKELEAFESCGATVLGISGGDQKSKAKFCAKHKLGLTLLSDTDFEVAKKFGAFGDKTFMGRKFKGVFRSTFVLDDEKRVIEVFDSVKAAGHAKEVLAFLRSVTPGAAKVLSVSKGTSMESSKRARPVSRKSAPKRASKPIKKPTTARKPKGSTAIKTRSRRAR